MNVSFIFFLCECVIYCSCEYVICMNVPFIVCVCVNVWFIVLWMSFIVCVNISFIISENVSFIVSMNVIYFLFEHVICCLCECHLFVWMCHLMTAIPDFDWVCMNAGYVWLSLDQREACVVLLYVKAAVWELLFSGHILRGFKQRQGTLRFGRWRQNVAAVSELWNELCLFLLCMTKCCSSQLAYRIIGCVFGRCHSIRLASLSGFFFLYLRKLVWSKLDEGCWTFFCMAYLIPAATSSWHSEPGNKPCLCCYIQQLCCSQVCSLFLLQVTWHFCTLILHSCGLVFNQFS